MKANPTVAAGTIRFMDGAAVLGTATLVNGTATLAAKNLAPGSHSIVAVYSGDSYYNPASSSALTLKVNRIPTATTLTSGDNPAGCGEPVTFTALLFPTAPTGAVRFLDGWTQLGSVPVSRGAATLTVRFPAKGTHSIAAPQGGDANFAGGVSTALIETVRP